MAQRRRSGKLAVILHADIAGSTTLVQQDEDLAHERIQNSFQRFSNTITQYHGQVRELRGDALLAQFERASDAVPAALAFQAEQAEYTAQLNDPIQPTVRVGIAMGEVIVADNTVTGAGVVLAQRVEQLAEPGGVCITGAIHEALPQRMPFVQANLGEQQVKGFDEPVHVYRVELKSGESIPPPQEYDQREGSVKRLGRIAAVAAIVLVIAGGAVYWFKPWAPEEEPASVERMAFPLPDKPSIAVLPFDNLSDDQEQAYFADGITNDIITDLSRFGDLVVIAAHSTFAYKGKPVKVQQVAEELGVRYVVEGSVQKAGNQVRINVQFIDAITGEHLWAERYARDLNDVFAVQDEIVQKIVGTLGAWTGQVAAVTVERARHKGTTDLTAYEHFLLGVELGQRFTKEDNTKAREALKKAIQRDPRYARAYAALAWTHWFDWRRGWSESKELSAARAYDLAKKAVELDDNEAEAHWILAEVYFAIRKQPEEAMAAFERALELNPNHADILADWGGYAMPGLTGKADEGMELVKKAMRLNPAHADWYERGLGFAAYIARRYDEAISAFRKVEHHSLESTAFAASYAQLGRLEEARAEMAKFLELQPQFSIGEFVEKFYFKNPADLEHYIDGLRKAGLPEHPPLELPDKPSIAVLPFKNFSSDVSLDYMSDGISEDIITALARSPWMLVMSRTSSFAYKDRAITVQQVGEELGVQYVLEGSVQKGSNTVRVTAQLIDTTDGSHLWAERFDQAGGDVLEIQDAVTEKINQTVGSLSGVLLGQAARERAWRKEGVKLEEYDYVLRGHDHFLRWTQAEMAKAREIFEQGLMRFPGSAVLRAKVAWARYVEVLQGWSADPESDAASSIQLAEEVLADQRASLLAEYLAHWVLAYLYSTADVARAMEEIEAAVALVPGGGMTRADLAGFQFFTGQTKQGWENMAMAERIDPHYAWIIYYKAFGLRIAGECGEAVLMMEAFFESPLKYLFIAACREQLNEHAEAKIALAKAEELWPGVTVSAHRDTLGFSDQPVVQEYLEDLRRAGLPN